MCCFVSHSPLEKIQNLHALIRLKKKKERKLERNINEKEKRLNCASVITAIIFLCHYFDNKNFVWKLLIYGPFRQSLLNKATLISQDPEVGQFKATKNCNSYFCWLNIYELDLTQTKFMKGAALGLPILSLTNGNLYLAISHTPVHPGLLTHPRSSLKVCRP